MYASIFFQAGLSSSVRSLPLNKTYLPIIAFTVKGAKASVAVFRLSILQPGYFLPNASKNAAVTLSVLESSALGVAIICNNFFISHLFYFTSILWEFSQKPCILQ